MAWITDCKLTVITVDRPKNNAIIIYEGSGEEVYGVQIA